VRIAVALTAAALAVAALPAAGGAQEANPRPGGSVRIAYAEPTCFNPLSQPCHTGLIAFPRPVWQLVMAGAFEVGRDFTYRPKLVSHVTVRRNPFTLTYHVRPQARWSDGVPVSAADFVFSHGAIVGRMPPFLQGVHADVLRIRARGPKTVEVVLRSQVASWRQLFEYVLPHHALAGEDLGTVWRNGIDNPKTGRPIGSGPFLLSRWERGRQLTLVRNPGYWSRRAHLDRLVWLFLPEGRENDSKYDALIAGEFEFAAGPPTPAELRRLQRSPRVRVASGPTASYEHLLFRLGPGGHPALKNRAVRQAIAHAIDREALVRALFPGLAPAARPHDSVVFAARHVHYRPSWSRYRNRAGAGPREARRLLGSAGCRRGADGIYRCAGEKLSLRAVTTAGSPVRQQTLAIIRDQLDRVGIELLPTFLPNRVWLDRVLPAGDFDVGLFTWNLSPDVGGEGAYAWGCQGLGNFGGYCNRQVTRNFNQARSILDPRRQARVVNLADAQIARDVPGLPLYSPRFFVAYKRDLRGIAWRPGGFNEEGWWLDR
jgi:peptide/nickel transport system substrate-binding protein